MRSLWKYDYEPIRTAKEWLSVIALIIFLFILAWAMAAGFGRPPDSEKIEPDPQIEAIIQEQQELGQRMENLEQDMQEMLQHMERIMGAGEVSMTAYCTCPLCCGKYADGYTATGIKAVAGDGSRDNPHLVAVDPRVIPMGSMIYIQGLGYARAVDVGGAIKEQRIDVLMPSHQAARQFGRKWLEFIIPSVLAFGWIFAFRTWMYGGGWLLDEKVREEKCCIPLTTD